MAKKKKKNRSTRTAQTPSSGSRSSTNANRHTQLASQERARRSARAETLRRAKAAQIVLATTPEPAKSKSFNYGSRIIVKGSALTGRDIQSKTSSKNGGGRGSSPRASAPLGTTNKRSVISNALSPSKKRDLKPDTKRLSVKLCAKQRPDSRGGNGTARSYVPWQKKPC